VTVFSLVYLQQFWSALSLSVYELLLLLVIVSLVLPASNVQLFLLLHHITLKAFPFRVHSPFVGAIPFVYSECILSTFGKKLQSVRTDGCKACDFEMCTVRIFGGTPTDLTGVFRGSQSQQQIGKIIPQIRPRTPVSTSLTVYHSLIFLPNKDA
jgi:hypothetical protein